VHSQALLHEQAAQHRPQVHPANQAPDEWILYLR
jgi:hypothetical protein